MAAHANLRVVPIRTIETFDLRRRVLRTGVASTDVAMAGDDAAGTFHLGATLGEGAAPWPPGSLVGVCSWMSDPYSAMPDAPAYRLRGMATDPGARGLGIGAALLAAGVSSAAGSGARVLWAQARESALGFYLHAGWELDGDRFIDATTGLPHHRIVRWITAS
jgi:GNAT superfamily N-acetyltransferase